MKQRIGVALVAVLALSAPKPGDVWRFNIGRGTGKNVVPSKPALLLWSPNLESRTFAPYAMGRLTFE